MPDNARVAWPPSRTHSDPLLTNSALTVLLVVTTILPGYDAAGNFVARSEKGMPLLNNKLFGPGLPSIAENNTPFISHRHYCYGGIYITIIILNSDVAISSSEQNKGISRGCYCVENLFRSIIQMG